MAGSSVLLVEDDVALARALALALTDAGDRVHVVTSARDGRAAVDAGGVDVVLLDLGLPDGDGLALCRELRAAGSIPIIVVTARAASADVVAGLEAGADDYVTKPVVGSELSARIRALLRRTVGPRYRDVVVVADLEIDLRHGSARRGGSEISLTRTERALLRDLALHAGDPVTREELLERVWGYGDIGDTRLLDVHVRRLRMKVETDPGDPRLIVTVRGLGYRLET